MNLGRLLLFILFSTCTISAIAQKNRLSIRVISPDSTAVQAIISVKRSDSTLLQKSITDSTGSFQCTLKDGHYLLQTEAIGFITAFTAFDVKAGKHSLPATIILATDFKNLDGIVVTAKKPAVIVKTDTTEYNVAFVKTGREATVEDIFQKLPGIEVSRNGNIKANENP